MSNEKAQLYAERLEGLDGFVESVMKDWRVPGMALAVVKDEEVIYSKGFGLRDPQNNLEVDADTLFRIASNTKAFTAMSVAMLVDEGKLEWDKPVKHYIPTFQLKDPYATEHVSAKDLLCHRTGLPAHDWALDDNTLSRAEITQRFRHLEPSCEMRTKLQYNNWMYMLAGHLVEVVTGDSWEHFVQERIFNPLGMAESNFSFYMSRKRGNFAENFYEKDGELKQYLTTREFDPEFCFPRGPAGAINSSANEMAKWLILQLNKGKFGDRQLVSEANLFQMHSPQMIDNWNSPYEELGESSCGLGWFIWSYRGHKIVLHGGFFGSQVILMPRQRIGIAFLPTLGSPLQDIIPFHIFDRLLGLDEIPWNQRKKEETAKAKEQERINREKAVSDRKTGTQPSHPLEDYCGLYEHPAYGKFPVKLKDGMLFTEESGKDYALRHYHYDTFEVIEESGETIFKVTFHTDPKGIVHSASAPLEAAVKDIVFARKN